MSDGSRDNRPKVQLRILDQNGQHLSGATVDYFWGESSSARIEVGDIEPTVSIPLDVETIRFEANYPGARTVRGTAQAGDHEAILRFNDAARKDEPRRNWQVIGFTAFAVCIAAIVVVAIVAAFYNEVAATFVFGIAFLAVILALAFVFPEPTPFQYLVMRIALALAGAGIATMLTGFINVEIPEYVKAGGALAVFVMIYAVSTATLMQHPRT